MIKALNLKLAANIRISKHKNIFAKGGAPNRSEEFLVIKKVENIVPWTYVLKDFNAEEIAGTLYEKKYQKANQTDLRIERVIKKKSW